MGPAFLLFQHELEWVRLRAMLAVERLEAQPDRDVQERIAGDLSRLEAVLAEERPTGRVATLAARLGLDGDDVDLLWTAVAVAADPAVLPHAQVLGGAEARRGLSLAVHAMIAGLDGARARALVDRLLGGHPLFRDHLLAWGDG